MLACMCVRCVCVSLWNGSGITHAVLVCCSHAVTKVSLPRSLFVPSSRTTTLTVKKLHQVLVQHGMLNKRGSLDLIEDLDMNTLYVAPGNDSLRINKLDLEAVEAISGPWPSSNPKRPDLNLDDIPFEHAFDEQSSYGSNNSLSGGLGIGPSSLGRTPPDPFTGSFEETMSHLRNNPPKEGLSSHSHSLKPHPGAIDIPGTTHHVPRDSGMSDMVNGGGMMRNHGISHSHHPQYSTHGPTHPAVATAGGNGDRKHYIGAYSPDARRKRIQRFLEKRKRRVWTKKVTPCDTCGALRHLCSR